MIDLDDSLRIRYCKLSVDGSEDAAEYDMPSSLRIILSVEVAEDFIKQLRAEIRRAKKDDEVAMLHLRGGTVAVFTDLDELKTVNEEEGSDDFMGVTHFRRAKESTK